MKDMESYKKENKIQKIKLKRVQHANASLEGQADELIQTIHKHKLCRNRERECPHVL